MTRRSTAVALCLLAIGCVPATSARETFDAEVVPVLERHCASSACHGVPPGAEARGEAIDWDLFFVHTDRHGLITDRDQAYAAALRVVNVAEDPAFSSLLRKPLAVRNGGLGHLGGESFESELTPDYQALRRWIEMEAAGGEDPEPLSHLEQLFADTVQPVLRESTCMTSRCHGPEAGAIPYQLDVGYRGRFPIAATRHNYEQTLAVVTLDGYPRESRLLRKSQPLGPGTVHKGLSFDFYAGDPGGGIDAIVAWICAERRARTGEGCAAEGAPPIAGFVFVRGPVEPRHAFDLDAFVPGRDLYLATVGDASLAPVDVENLTAALHPDGPADVRDPAVSRDGRRVLFAMRTRPDEGHHLWLLDLETREARQLTHENGPLAGGGLATDRDPTWGPDDSVWFVSTRAGVVADQGRLLDADLYSLDLATGEVRRFTHTPHVERKPVFYDLGEEAGGEVAFSVLRDTMPDRARAHVFRFPPGMETEYHQHFGITPVETFVYDLRELPDGRYAGVVGDLPAEWRTGQLAVVDRNLGPEIRGTEHALESYQPPMIRIDGLGPVRDPAPLPDGRVLLSHVAGDPSAPRIELIELAERVDGTGTEVAHAAVLVEEPGVALTDPEPISLRAPVRAGASLPPSPDATALLRHQGLPMIDALLTHLAPSGARRPREDIAYVRLVEHLPLSAEERRALSGDAPEGATSTGLGLHGPARILAELPVASDGSFQARVPVGVPFRLQALDHSRMAVGTMHDRWFYTLGGQVLTQGVPVDLYETMCAACHGNADGVGGRPPTLAAPDVVTGASLTEARYQDRDPRLPLDPPVLGDATRVEVDFRRDVQPILDRRCAACHAAPEPAAALDLTGRPTAHFTVAYESLLRDGDGSGNGRAYVDVGEGRASTSHLAELLTGIELDAPRALDRPGRPHVGDLSDEELLTLIRWIELGATFVGATEAEP